MKKNHCLLVQTPNTNKNNSQAQAYSITQSPLTIGTSADCDVQLQSPKLGGLRASISLTPIGALLQNQGSEWGISVNGMTHDEFYMSHFDTLRIGDNTDTFLLARYLERPASEAEEIILAPHLDDIPAQNPRDIDPLSTFFLPKPFYALLRALQGRASLILLNIDKFKGFNDFYGFPGGDSLLRMISLIIRSLIPAPNLIGRITGDRFAVLLPGGDLQTAAHLAEEIRAMVEQSSVYQARATIRAIVAPFSPGDTSKEGIERLSVMLDDKGKNTVTIHTSL
jgi:diguanylate cyclase (GGDEF)-like protein